MQRGGIQKARLVAMKNVMYMIHFQAAQIVNERVEMKVLSDKSFSHRLK